MNHELDDQLLDLWRELLDDDAVGPDTDFTALGGDSIFAMRLIARVWDEFGLELTPGVLFDHGTVRALGEYIAGRLPAPTAA